MNDNDSAQLPSLPNAATGSATRQYNDNSSKDPLYGLLHELSDLAQDEDEANSGYFEILEQYPDQLDDEDKKLIAAIIQDENGHHDILRYIMEKHGKARFEPSHRTQEIYDHIISDEVEGD